MVPLLSTYVAIGILVALAFVIAGVTKVQSQPVTLGARILLWPGAFLLWPYVAARWLRSCRSR